MGFRDLAFLHSRTGFLNTFFRDLAETKALGPSNVFNLWLGTSKDMHPIAKFCGIIRTVTKLR